MKQKIVLSLIFVCAFMVTTRAQISKGAVWVGGSIGYNQSKTKMDTTTYKTSTANINPGVGFVVKDNLVVGVSLLYRQQKTNNYLSKESDKDETYGVGLFVRKYFPVINRLYVFGDAGLNYNHTKGSTTNTYYPNTVNKTTSKGWLGGVNITPGVSFAVTKKFHLETSLSNLLGVAYATNKITPVLPPGSTAKPVSSSSDSFTAGLFTDGKAQFNIGCRFLL
jgi:hypothetical protein